jgi:cytosine/adenosine deaminase-related metal-dependent hydrolase
MILENIGMWGMTGQQRIVIEDGRIQAIQLMQENRDRVNGRSIQFRGAIAIPGLINSHDHLDFNLFPLLANRVYNNYTEWARDIRTSGKKVIDEVLKIPEALRVEWGCYKNLLNGFTTVVNHGKRLILPNTPVDVYQSCTSLHSTAFEKYWKLKLNNPLNRETVVAMHIGEGRDEMASKEINAVTRWNLAGKKIVAVHGIAMNEKQSQQFKGLVWCPASNEKLIGETAAVGELEHTIPIVFGTDSTLSAGWNAWTHFRIAIRKPGITEGKLLRMLTSTPADLWDMKGKGRLLENACADVMVIEQKEDLFELNPENILMVIQKGKIRLFDETLAAQIQLPSFAKLTIKGRVKFVEGDLPGLINKIRSYCPSIEIPVSV